MRNLVLVPPPVLDDDLRIDAIAKPLHRQTIIAELAVEGLVGTVLPNRPAGHPVPLQL